MSDGSPSMLRSTLLAGVAVGVIAGLPYVDVFNCCTGCSLVVLGGFLASMLYSRECRAASHPFRPANGAVVGLIAGAFYAVTVTVTSSVMTLAIGQPGAEWLLGALIEVMQSNPDVPAESLEQLETAREEIGKIDAWKVVTGFLTAVLVGAAFSTIGGLIGGAMFKVEQTPRPERSGEGPAPPAM
jgi:hypothetical protein